MTALDQFMPLLITALVLLGGLSIHLCMAMHGVLRLLADTRTISSLSLEMLSAADGRPAPDCAAPGTGLAPAAEYSELREEAFE
jgi:hypothetical protein